MKTKSPSKRATPRNHLSLLRPATGIVQLDKAERHVFADSRKVAELFGKRHDNVTRAVDKLLESGQIAHLTFEVSKYLDSSGKVNQFWNMDRDGFMLLTMGFTGPKALAVKLQFIAAFNAMETYIREAERVKLAAAPARLEMKTQRHEFTDHVAMLVKLAKAQGSHGAPFIFSDLTKTTYRALGLFAGQRVPEGFRERLTKREIADCVAVETAMARAIERQLTADTGGSYKLIRDAAKRAAVRQAELLGYEVSA